MKCEDDRNQRIREAAQTQSAKLESQMETLRAIIDEARRILPNHEIALNRKVERGAEIGKTQKRMDDKRKLVTKLEAEMVELDRQSMRIRDDIRRLLTFNPVQDTLDQIAENQQGPKKRQGPKLRQAKEGEWEIPNSLFKTFQDIFTPPEARILPDYRRMPNYREYQGLPIDHCPVDPERIPDWFVEKFELGDLKGLTDFEKLELKATLIPEVRNLFKHMTPLKADGRQTHRVMVLEDYNPSHDGNILISSYSGTKAEDKDHKVMQVFCSAYEAQRREFHAGGKLGKEKRKLRGIKARIERVQRELVGMRKNDPRKSELVRRILSGVEAIGMATNPYGAEVKGILESVSNITDSSGKHNSSAACARIVRAINLIEERLPKISKKKKWISMDAEALEDVIHDSETTIGEAREATLEICQGLERGEDIQGRLRGVPCLDDLTVKPFSQYAEKITKRLALLKNGQNTRDNAINAYVACKVAELQSMQEEILSDITVSPMETSIEALIVRVDELLDTANSKETYRLIRTGKNEPYRKMVEKMKEVTRGLGQYSRRGLSSEERKAMYKSLKIYLEDIDFIEILEKL